MKLLCTIILALALPFGVVRADTPKKDAPPADNTPSKADVDKFLAFFDKLVDTIVADKADCTKMATDITKLVDSNQDLLKKASEAKAKGQKLPQDARDHMDASSKKMISAIMEKCAQDKGVQAALQRMQVK
jgi:ElaB/YqjD/DUF883 family membrane-anchored ribosome-binding protein